ncbi:MAG: lactate dehydrogenase [Nocardioides sp.]|nr:lactate dehydrogenase [Nocardioides sp.]
MTHGDPATTTADRPTAPTAPTAGLTVYGCGPDEAALFRALAPGLGLSASITAAAASEETAELALGCRCVSVGHKTRVDAGTLRALSRVGVAYLSTRSIGFNHIDMAAAEAVGIRVENVAYSPDSVADHTLMLILMAVRSAKAVIRRAEIHDYRLPDVRGRELRDLTVGVVGTGHIGSAVVDRLQGFGCRVLAHDMHPTTIAEYVDLDDLLRAGDIVTLHTPLTDETHHLLSGSRIRSLKPGAYVVNTGRGALLDTEALVEALESGRLAGAALDVVEGEDGIFYADRSETPVESDLLVRLQKLPNAIVTPHMAFYTDHALRDTVENSIINCARFERARHMEDGRAWTS